MSRTARYLDDLATNAVYNTCQNLFDLENSLSVPNCRYTPSMIPVFDHKIRNCFFCLAKILCIFVFSFCMVAAKTNKLWTEMYPWTA